VRSTLPFLAARGIATDEAAVRAALPAVRERAQTFLQTADLLDPLLREPPVMDEAAAGKFLVAAAAARLRGLGAALAAAAEWTAPALEAAVTAWLAGQGLELKDIGQPVRVALTGRTASPSLFEVLAILGPDRALARLTRAAERAERGPGER
jgi:glutamyl-tRNA synthetase